RDSGHARPQVAPGQQWTPRAGEGSAGGASGRSWSMPCRTGSWRARRSRPWPLPATAGGASAAGRPARSVERAAEGGAAAVLGRRADAGHQRLVVPKVVQGAEERAQHLVAAVQVAQVGAAEAAGAGRAAAAFLDRPRVALELRIADAQRAGGG